MTSLEMVEKLDEVLKYFAGEIYANNIKLGWRGEDTEPRTFGDEVSLIHSEVSEMLEAYRDYGVPGERYRNAEGEWTEEFTNPDGTLNKPEGIGAEAADVLIRLLDVCWHYQIDLARFVDEKMRYNQTRPHRHGGKNL